MMVNSTSSLTSAQQLDGKILKEIELQRHTTLDKIASLSTRMEVVEWILKYQQLSVDINLGNNPIPNTTGAGFISALHLADFSDKLNLVSEKTFQPLINTLIRMQKDENLHKLNSTSFADFLYFQEIETDEHRKACYGENLEQTAQYDFIGRVLTDLGEQRRAVLCQGSSYRLPVFFAYSINKSISLVNKIKEHTYSLFATIPNLSNIYSIES